MSKKILENIEWFHDDEWLDFNMLQTSHDLYNNSAAYTVIENDYNKLPAKPCMDGEAPYEDHAVDWDPANGYFSDHDIRKSAYWSAFAGACSHVYGANCVWQFSRSGWEYFVSRRYWKEWNGSLSPGKDLPGAFDMKHLRDLLMSRPFLDRIPDQGREGNRPLDRLASFGKGEQLLCQPLPPHGGLFRIYQHFFNVFLEFDVHLRH